MQGSPVLHTGDFPTLQTQQSWLWPRVGCSPHPRLLRALLDVEERQLCAGLCLSCCCRRCSVQTLRLISHKGNFLLLWLNPIHLLEGN